MTDSAAGSGRPKASAALSFLGEQVLGEYLAHGLKRLREGMDATKVKILQHQGTIVEGPEQVDYPERREAAKEILKLGDYYPDKLDLNIGGEGLTVVLKGLDEERV